MDEDASKNTSIPKAKLEILNSLLATELANFQTKRDQNKRKAIWAWTCATLFSAANTVVLGFQVGETTHTLPYMRDAALIMSSIVTWIVAYESLFNHRAHWLRYTETVNDLLSLQARIQYCSVDGDRKIPESAVDKFFDEFEGKISQTNEWWQKERSESLREQILEQQTEGQRNITSQ